MKNLILTVLIISMMKGDCLAQTLTPQTINISGGTYHQGYYVIDWSVGEMALVNQIQSSDGLSIVSNGIIQPFTNYIDNVNYSRSFTEEEIRILPNPTRDIVEVNYLSYMRGPVVFKLFDATGRMLYVKTTPSYGYGFLERIDMRTYASGAYMLYISVNSSDPGAFKKACGYKILKVN